jgi:peptidoglycan hydrolase CwlO-like protein
VATRLEAIHDKIDANQMRVEPKKKHQEKMDAWIADMKNDQKEMTACQDAMEANLEKIEPNP